MKAGCEVRACVHVFVRGEWWSARHSTQYPPHTHTHSHAHTHSSHTPNDNKRTHTTRTSANPMGRPDIARSDFSHWTRWRSAKLNHFSISSLGPARCSFLDIQTRPCRTKKPCTPFAKQARGRKNACARVIYADLWHGCAHVRFPIIRYITLG